MFVIKIINLYSLEYDMIENKLKGQIEMWKMLFHFLQKRKLTLETIFEDELPYKDPYLYRTKGEVEALYATKPVGEGTVKEFLIDKIKKDDDFAKRCMILLNSDSLFESNLVDLYQKLDIQSD